MLRGRLASLSIGFFISANGLLSLACDKPAEEAKKPELEPQVVSSGSPTPQIPNFLQATATPVEAKPSPLPPPKLDEVREAVVRVFVKAAALDERHTPSFVVGDFNGDGSEDLAVVTKTSEGSLAEINNELANWILEDPRTVPIPGTIPSKRMVPGKPVKTEKGDILLAIIHGVGPQGWRNREARQTFLLRNGAGSDMVVQSAKTLRGSGDKRKLPRLRGDAIRQTLGGKSGILFWTGAKYAWYSAPE
jgi:hypothetical protein